MRPIIVAGVAGLGLLLSGCGSYNQVSQGWQGATSPAESGQQGAAADQAGPYGSEATEKQDDQIKPLDGPLTNGNTDPSMEGSGNLAAQGDYKAVMAAEKQRREEIASKTPFTVAKAPVPMNAPAGKKAGVAAPKPMAAGAKGQ